LIAASDRQGDHGCDDNQRDQDSGGLRHRCSDVIARKRLAECGLRYRYAAINSERLFPPTDQEI
jgi:hypothetical protein